MQHFIDWLFGDHSKGKPKWTRCPGCNRRISDENPLVCDSSSDVWICARCHDEKMENQMAVETFIRG